MKTARNVRWSLDKQIPCYHFGSSQGNTLMSGIGIQKQMENNEGVWKTKEIRKQEAKKEKKWF